MWAVAGSWLPPDPGTGAEWARVCYQTCTQSSLDPPLKCGAGRDSRGEGAGVVPLGSVPSLEGVHGAGSTPALFAFERQPHHGWERKSLPVRYLLGGWALNDTCSLISEVVAGFVMSSLSPVSSAANFSHYLYWVFFFFFLTHPWWVLVGVWTKRIPNKKPVCVFLDTLLKSFTVLASIKEVVRPLGKASEESLLVL